MDTKIRLTRKPVTTISWIAVLTAMAMLLGIGANLLHSARSLLGTLDQHHTTIAVQTLEPGLTPAGNWNILSATLNEKKIRKLASMPMVKDIDLRTLTGAYIPELNARVGLGNGPTSQTNYDGLSWDSTMNESYDEVILTGTVMHCWTLDDEDPEYYNLTELGYEEPLTYRQMNAIVEIDEIIVANGEYNFFHNERFPDYTGEVCVSVLAYVDPGEEEEGEEPYNFFRVGESYILSGTYSPRVTSGGPEVDLPPELAGHFYPTLTLGRTYAVPGKTISYTESLIEGDTMFYYPECIIEWSWEQPRIRYPEDKILPTATRLTGTAQELLATDDLWADTVELFEMTQHTFPVLGTENLESMYAFNRNEAVFVEGRSFTQEEYDAGDKVCVIEESIANAAGIHAGDTLSFSQFLCGTGEWDGNTSLKMAEDNGMLINPGVGRYPLGSGLVTENEEFTVVGVYKLSRSWDSSSFAFTPNTIFIPQKAQIPGGYGGASTIDGPEGDRVRVNGSYGIFLSLILENGRAEEFLEMLPDVVTNPFYVFDQGYADAVESVSAMEREAWKLIALAAFGWLLLLMLYVLLYQDKERSNLGILRSVGGTPAQGRKYLFGSGLLIAFAGILMGTLCSSGVTRLVSRQLAEFMVSEGTMQTMSGGMELGAEAMADILSRASLPMQTLLLLTAGQLAVIALILWLHAFTVSRKPARALLSKT